jgi:putative transposase
MPRLRRIGAPGYPHLVTARVNHGQRLFFNDANFMLYRNLLTDLGAKAGLAVWAWVAMPNHVHLIAVSGTQAALGTAIGEAHRRYAALANVRTRRRGHVFQTRFSSVVLDEAHLIAAIRYVSMNPVRAKLTHRPEDWPWSSVRAHAGVGTDGLTVQGAGAQCRG